VYLFSLRTSIRSNTLLHRLITSLNDLNAASSFKAPLVAESVATSSTNARSCRNYNGSVSCISDRREHKVSAQSMSIANQNIFDTYKIHIPHEI